MRLKGHAKSVDIMAMMFDQARFMLKFNKLCSYIEDQMREFKDVLAPGTEPTARMFLPLDDALLHHAHYNRASIDPSAYGEKLQIKRPATLSATGRAPRSTMQRAMQAV